VSRIPNREAEERAEAGLKPSLADTGQKEQIMSDEAAVGSAGAPDGGRHSPSGGGIGSPFQTRAQFLKNWGWHAVIGINRGACERGRAQHGINSEAGAACEQEWQTLQVQALTLGETFDRLRAFHRKAPFLFFNGNTFATIGRELSFALFSDLPPGRKREVGSAVAHYIAGVLDRESMVEIVESLSESASLQSGDLVKTLRGSAHGVVVTVQPDGRVLWRPAGSSAELLALPESLLRERRTGL
jgi:hypothetical protein